MMVMPRVVLLGIVTYHGNAKGGVTVLCNAQSVTMDQ